MRRSLAAIAVALLSAVMLTGQPPRPGNSRAPANPPPFESVLFIGWDGVQRAHLLELMMAGRLPNLTKLADEGSFETIGISGHNTDTKSGWTQLLTGYDPEVTGVYSNGRYQPIPKGLTAFERVETFFGPDQVTTIFITGKAHHVGSLGPGLRKEGPKQEEQMRPGEPWHIAKASIDVFEGDKQRQADEVGTLARRHLGEVKGRFFAFVHFSDPDHAGHAHGENSPEYEAAIVACDDWLGRLRQLLAEEGLQNTGIYVVTDHGFDEGAMTHAYAPRSWLVTNDKAVIRGGHMREVAPTVLMRMGVSLNEQPPFPGGVLTR
jgi:predicted AlkP superfamily pyrophosphatase or phosphodiesterase